jgi:hypothetical protein
MGYTDFWNSRQIAMPDSPEIWFFRKNVDPELGARRAGKIHLAYLTFHYTPEDETGIPIAEHNTKLLQAEDPCIEILEAEDLSVAVGSVVKGGIKDLLFYANDPDEFARRVESLKAKYPEFAEAFQLECEIMLDAEWAQYEDLP